MHGGREIRKAMSAIAVAFRGCRAPQEGRPAGVVLFRSGAAPAGARTDLRVCARSGGASLHPKQANPMQGYSWDTTLGSAVLSVAS